MAIAIDKNLIDDVNNPSYEVINYCIKKHELEIPRLQMLFDYYMGLPHKKDEIAKNKTPQEMDEIYVNNAKYVTDMMTGIEVGNPISYASDSDKNMDEVQNALYAMRINKHDKELVKGLSSMGVGYELHYLSMVPGTESETMPKVAWIDPRGMILAVDDTVDRNYLFAIRPVRKEDLSGQEYWEITVYTAAQTIVYKSTNKQLVEGQCEEIDRVENFYNMVPVVEFRNNEEKQGDYEQQLSQIDAYNLLQTTRIKDKKNFVKAMMILYGFRLPEEKPAQTENGNYIINAPAQGEDGAKVEFATNTLDETQTQILADSILDDFHKTAYIPNLNDENFAGTQSGEAMKYKLLGLLLALSVKTGYLEDGIVRRLKLIENIVNIKGANNDTSGCTIQFKVNLPFNRKDVIDQIRDSQDFVPLLISLGWLDDVDDPQAIIDMLDDQKEKNIEYAQKMVGMSENDGSHSDLEGLNDDEDEEDTSKPASVQDDEDKKKGGKK